MTGTLQRLRRVGLLPAILLLVLVVAQVDRADHLHGIDDPVSECSQCRSYTDDTALSVDTSPVFLATVTVSADFSLVQATLAAHYRYNARGPPTFS
jgi:hypothetical protein